MPLRNHNIDYQDVPAVSFGPQLIQSHAHTPPPPPPHTHTRARARAHTHTHTHTHTRARARKHAGMCTKTKETAQQKKTTKLVLKRIPTESGSSGSIATCWLRTKTLPRHARHKTRSNAEARAQSITPATKLPGNKNKKGRKDPSRHDCTLTPSNPTHSSVARLVALSSQLRK